MSMFAWFLVIWININLLLVAFLVASAGLKALSQRRFDQEGESASRVDLGLPGPIGTIVSCGYRLSSPQIDGAEERRREESNVAVLHATFTSRMTHYPRGI